MPNRESDQRMPDYQELLAAFGHARKRFEQSPSPDTAQLLQAGADLLFRELSKPGKFELGRLLATPGAMEAMDDARQIPPEFLLPHKHGAWGELPPEDIQENEWSLENGARLLSRYSTRLGQPLYVITEWDRSITTVLRPDEY